MFTTLCLLSVFIIGFIIIMIIGVATHFNNGLMKTLAKGLARVMKGIYESIQFWKL